MRDFMIEAHHFDTELMLRNWRWLVSPQFTPGMISMFGDWVLGAPDGTIWTLSLLEGTCEQIARDAAEYNALKRDFKWLSHWFLAGWQETAERAGIAPGPDECIGWTFHPALGGQFSVSNMTIYDMVAYQAVMGELHRRLWGAEKA